MGNILKLFYWPQSKGSWKKNTTKEHVGGSKLERPVTAIVKSQLARCFSRITFADWATKLGCHGRGNKGYNYGRVV
jgi:hypothetical protein